MSTRKKKEPAAKKQKNFKPNEVEKSENPTKTASEEISAEYVEPEETEETEEDMLEKERSHARNMEERFLRVNAEFENYKKRIIRENSERLKFFKYFMCHFVDHLQTLYHTFKILIFTFCVCDCSFKIVQ